MLYSPRQEEFLFRTLGNLFRESGWLSAYSFPKKESFHLKRTEESGELLGLLFQAF